jgi:hypothetical protein
VLARFLAHEIDGLGISVITASELYWGVCKSGSVRNQTTLDKFLSPLNVLDYDQSPFREPPFDSAYPPAYLLLFMVCCATVKRQR